MSICSFAAYSFKRDSKKKVCDRYEEKQGSEAEDPKDSESSMLKNHHLHLTTVLTMNKETKQNILRLVKALS